MINNIIVLLLVVVTAIISHPLAKKQLDYMINSNPCLLDCMKILESSDEINIMKTVNYDLFFLKLEKICSVIDNAKKCVDRCGIKSNPFALSSVDILCSPKKIQEVKDHYPCLQTNGRKVKATCKIACGDHARVVDDIEKKTEEYNSAVEKNDELFNTIMLLTNKACGMTKCYARCNRLVYPVACLDLGDYNIGEFIYSSLKEVNEALINDIEEAGIKTEMMKSLPPQCNFLHTRNVFLNETADSQWLEFTENEMMTLQKKQETNSIEGKSDPDYRNLDKNRQLNLNEEMIDNYDKKFASSEILTDS